MGEVIQLPVNRGSWKVDLVYKDGTRTVHTPGSNFWTTEGGFNVEVEFQAEKWVFLKKPIRAKLVRAAGYRDGRAYPYDAKKKARSWQMTQIERREWDGVRLDVMRRLVLTKARISPEFREWLLGTDTASLVETNWWCDQFWGNCTCPKHAHTPGSNWLGHILGDLRRMITASGVRGDGASTGS
jgi:ribA/ribD-fused uncharacterized protein